MVSRSIEPFRPIYLFAISGVIFLAEDIGHGIEK
jgi:hypothetical protein